MDYTWRIRLQQNIVILWVFVIIALNASSTDSNQEMKANKKHKNKQTNKRNPPKY